MDIRELKHVVTLAREQSYTRAAEALGIAQPTLSRSIQAIEAKAKVRLFDRDRAGVHLTAVGRAFIERAAPLLAEATKLDALLAQAASAHAGEVAFGMAPLAASALLDPLLEASFRYRPELTCKVAIRSADALAALLAAEEIEFFICSEGLVPDAMPFRKSRLGWFPTSMLVRSGHPLLESDDPQDLTGFPLLHSGFLGANRKLPRELERLTQGSVHIIESYDILARQTERSDAIWFSSAYAVIQQIADGRLRELPFPVERTRPAFRMVMYSSERRSLSPAARNLKRECEGLIHALAEQLKKPAIHAEQQVTIR